MSNYIEVGVWLVMDPPPFLFVEQKNIFLYCLCTVGSDCD